MQDQEKPWNDASLVIDRTAITTGQVRCAGQPKKNDVVEKKKLKIIKNKLESWESLTSGYETIN